MDEFKEHDLIITMTHSVKESKGNALGLEGNQGLYVVGGICVSFIIMFIGMNNDWGSSSLFTVMAIPPVIACIYVFIFLRNKPPGYQKSLLHTLLLGSHDDVQTDQRNCNPYTKAVRKRENERNTNTI